MKRLNGWSVAVVLLSVAGCGGGGSSKPITTADFCMQYAGAICQIADMQCGLSTASCTSYQIGRCMANAASVTASGKRTFTPANVSACVNAVKAAYGGAQTITPSTLASIDLACGYVFQGSGVALQDSCTTQFECAGTTNGTIICDKGFCATQTSTAASMPCGNPGEVCVTDYYCSANSASIRICTASGVSGNPCDANNPCAHNLRCANGSCTTLLESGGACTANSDCAPAVPYCDPYANPVRCDTGLKFASDSPSCNCIAAGTSCGGGTTGAGGSVGTGGSGGAGGTGGLGGGRGGMGGGLGGVSGSGGLGGVSGSGGRGGMGGGLGGTGGGLGGVSGSGGLGGTGGGLGGLGGVGGGLGGVNGFGGLGGSVTSD